MITIEFLLTSLVIVLIPGTGVLYTVATGLSQGQRASAYAAFGCTMGIVPHLLATMLGLAAIMQAGAFAFQILKFAGALYLLYLAYMTWSDKSAFAVDDSPVKLKVHKLIFTAIAINSLNPKLTIFFLAFLPQFIAPNTTSPSMDILMLGAVFMAMTFAVFVVYGAAASTFRTWVMSSPRVQNTLRQGFTAVFIALSARLALAEK